MQINSTPLKIAIPDVFKPLPATTAAAGRHEIAAPTVHGDKVSITPVLRGGMENVRSLGAIVLGGQDQIETWERKGLKITDETLQKAFEVFNESFKEHMNNNSAKGTSFNRYQIIADTQAVPDWFRLEQESELAAISVAEVKTAFASGKLYYLDKISDGHSRETNVYREINRIGR